MKQVLLEDLDLVVLAVGMVPSTLDEMALNLDYRQGPELPVEQVRFSGFQFYLFPL